MEKIQDKSLSWAWNPSHAIIPLHIHLLNVPFIAQTLSDDPSSSTQLC